MRRRLYAFGFPKLAQVCSKAKERGVLVRYKKPNFVYICIKMRRKYKFKDNEKLYFVGFAVVGCIVVQNNIIVEKKE